VRLLDWGRLAEFSALHADAETSLKSWAKAMKARDFRHFVELKAAWGGTDYVNPFVVFDIGGNI